MIAVEIARSKEGIVLQAHRRLTAICMSLQLRRQGADAAQDR